MKVEWTEVHTVCEASTLIAWFTSLWLPSVPMNKSFYDWKWFHMTAKVILAVNNSFGNVEESHFCDRIIAFEHRWMKFIKLQRDYVENKTFFNPLSSLFTFSKTILTCCRQKYFDQNCISRLYQTKNIKCILETNMKKEFNLR